MMRLGAWMVLLSTVLVAGCGGPTPCTVCDAAVADDLETVRTVFSQVQEAERASIADMALYRMATDHALTRSHYGEIAALLLAGGGNPHQDRVYRTTGRSRAFIAEEFAAMDDAPTIKAFIDAGLDVRGDAGAFTLLRAVTTKSTGAARLLVAAGADPNRRLLETTALDEARKGSDREMLAILEPTP